MEKPDPEDTPFDDADGVECSAGGVEASELAGIDSKQEASSDIARIQRRIAALDEAIRSSGPVFNEAQNERSQLRAQLEVLQRAELVGQLVAARHELDDLGQEHERLTVTVATLQAERESLCREAGEWRGRAETQNVELERLRKLADGRTAEQIQHLAAQLSELEAELRRERQPTPRTGGAPAETADGSELAERNRQLQARLADSEAECAAMRERVATLQTLREGLDRECDKLRTRLASAVESERYRDEATHLRGQVEDLQREQREAAQRHSTAVSGYMLELNQRADLLRQREAEVQQLTHELSLARSAREEAITQLTSLRAEREILALRVREVEAARLRRRSQSADASEDSKPAASPALASAKAAPKETSSVPASTPSEPAMAPPPSPGDQRLTLFHLETDATRQKAVRDVAAKVEKVEYRAPAELESQPVAGTGLLVVNLAREAASVLTMLGEPQKWGLDRPRAYTYCDAGGSGFILGMVDFFPHPFSVDTCAAQLTRRGALRRLLVVSDDVDATSSIREVLGRLGCSTATAFDARQAVDLLPLIKPDVVLIDLSMPRGEGLRSVGRLGADPATAKVSVAMFWSKPVIGSDIAKSVSLAIREHNQPFPNLGFEFERFLTELRGKGAPRKQERAAG